MRYKLLILVTAVTVVFGGSVWAYEHWVTEDGHGRSIAEVEGEIRSELNLSPSDRIDPDAVPAPLLEELGEAVMSDVHPDEEVHTWMDRMMGGRGSASLASAHRWMGYTYLVDGYPSGGIMGGWGGRGMMHGGGMMGRGPAAGGYGSSADTYASPEEILKRRYARGEITTEEYNRMLEELRK
jgi:hypothetical protein